MKNILFRIINKIHRKIFPVQSNIVTDTLVKNNFNGNLKYSIGITTFDKRFETFFKPLISSIKKYNPEVEIILMVNCAYNSKIDESYRVDMLKFISEYKYIYPHFCTEFRSLSKLWNNELIFSSNDNVLILNDDVSIDESFFANFKNVFLNNNGSSFKINGSWSHVLLNRQEVERVGWFDERLLGVGDEDGDFEYRWNDLFNIPFKSFNIEGIDNHVDDSCDTNIKKHSGSKYTAFNRDFINKKYKIDFIKGKRYGMYEFPYTKIVEDLKLYSYEKFFWENKSKL